jgi:GNAT superfamily N-acetyltransferase
VPGVEVQPFADHHLGEAATLLARQHESLRSVEPLLPVAFGRQEQAEASLVELLARGATGSVALHGGALVAYVIGSARDATVWGPNIWVPPEGAATREPDVLRDVYADAAQRWVDEGRTAHYALVPAQDPAVVRAWSHLCFGVQHVHAARLLPREPGEPPDPPSGVIVRPAVTGDLAVIASFDVQLGEHLRRAPVFSRLAVPALAEALAEAKESLEDPTLNTVVAERGERVVGAAVGCDLSLSSAHSGPARLDGAAMLAWVVVDEGQRGAGVGRALADAVLTWAEQRGYGAIATDWRAANLPSSRAWPPLGFRETFLRMHRLIGY